MYVYMNPLISPVTAMSASLSVLKSTAPPHVSLRHFSRSGRAFFCERELNEGAGDASARAVPTLSFYSECEICRAKNRGRVRARRRRPLPSSDRLSYFTQVHILPKTKPCLKGKTLPTGDVA